MSTRTLISVIVGVMTITVAAVTFVVNMATREDVSVALAQHEEKGHRDKNGNLVSAPANVSEKTIKNEKDIIQLKEKTENLEKERTEIVKTQRMIEAKLDFLIERELIKAHNNPNIQSDLQEAAKRVRKRTRESSMEEDPFKGLKGLTCQDQTNCR